MKTISNGNLTIAVKECGAELASIKYNGREYLWQADETFWKRHSPVLFPIVGAVWNGEYRSDNHVFKMGQHGIARDMDFTLVDESSTELWYELKFSDSTLQAYPYPFYLKIGYRIEENNVHVMWHIENHGSKEMPFQIGAHPAFFWPLLSNEQISGPASEMQEPLNSTDRRGYFKIESDTYVLPLSIITEGGCIGKHGSIRLQENGYLPIDVNTFNDDALIIEDSHVNKVTLCMQDKTPYLSMSFTSPVVGLWSPPGKRAPFVCIEPWYGRTDSVNYTGIFEEKPWMQHLASGAHFDAEYTISIES